MISNLELCNRRIDAEFNKYKAKLEKALFMGQITYAEFMKVQKNLIYQQSKLKIKAIELFIDDSIPSINFKELLKLKGDV